MTYAILPELPFSENSGRVVSFSADFPLNSEEDAPFHCAAFDYSCINWDGFCDHLRDASISFTWVLVLLSVKFVS